jgi:2'-5' RNA ligase
VSLRTFVALELKDQALKQKIGELQRVLLATGAQLKVVETDNLHITLKFIGDLSEASVVPVVESLRAIRMPPFSAHFKGLGVFPSSSRINVVWLGVAEGGGMIGALSSLVHRNLAAYGKPEDFRAHLTIMRVKGGRNVTELSEAVRKLGEEEGGNVEFKEFQLKKSVLTPSGPQYSDLAVFPLV